MKQYRDKRQMLIVATLMAISFAMPAFAVFNSGSTGTDGAFSPTVNTELQLPPSGIFNFTSVNIPSGVTVTFKKNTTNTPVVILASGNVTIAGTINLNGTGSPHTGAAGDGNLGDDGIPGRGGPGGYDGGPGGSNPLGAGGAGLGPGGGGSGLFMTHSSGCCNLWSNGGGGGFAGAGGTSFSGGGGWPSPGGLGGETYGSTLLLPLVGGSGGGGGAGGSDFKGSGGGGGGGAILIAASGTVSITGAIVAGGASSGSTSGVNSGAAGGGGSGGAIRIVATTISGNGTLSANGAGPGSCGNCQGGGSGSAGRIRLEAENITRTANSSPGHTFGSPGPVFIAGLPTLRITSVAGVTAPAEPTGTADITLPATTANPVSVAFATTGVPVGNTVKLTVTPANGSPTNVVSPALTGTTDNATASVSVNLPGGPSTLQATTTYTIVASLGDALGNQFAQGERVEKIEVSASTQGPSTVTLITMSGKRYPMSGPLPAMAAAG